MALMYGVIGNMTPEYLLADPQGADAIAVPLEPGQGILKRGILVVRKSSGLWAAAATSDVANTNALAVLNETVDTGSDSDGLIAENAAVYRSGRFWDGKVAYYNSSASEYQAVTAAMKIVLAQFGILFDQVETAAEFDNSLYHIIYVANNSVTPAEPDVAIAAAAGTTYTVLNNSDTKLSFTAPATKSFSKWNTKADGTGTDYAAAATYSVTADLKLYAVWA